MLSILVTHENDGSQWVSLEDYRALQSKFRDFLDNVYDIVSVQCNDVGEAHAGLQEEIIAIRKSCLTSRAADAGTESPDTEEFIDGHDDPRYGGF